MTKIITLSEYGFKLSSDPDKWISCDKRFINSKDFKNLKVNDEVVNMQYNDKGFVTVVTVLDHKDKGEEVTKSQITSLNVCSRNVNSVSKPSLPSVQDNIKYGQCVNIAFTSVNLGGFVSEEAGIVYAFDRADKIYNEFNKRVGGN